MIESHPYLSTLPSSRAPNLTNILSINVMDLETQDHILNYQVPVAIKRHNVGLVVIDSITANYRAEHTSTTMAALSTRSGELAKLGHMLRKLAVTENVAVVVANQVSDRFSDAGDSAPYPLRAQRESGAASPAPRNISGVGSGPGDAANLSSSPAIQSSPYADEETAADGSGSSARNEILSLLHQQRFFTGWGDTRASNSDSFALGPWYQKPSQKTPALGLVWSTQIACRIALKKENRFDADVTRNYEGKSLERTSGNKFQALKDEGAGKKLHGSDASAEGIARPDRGEENQAPESGTEQLTTRVMKLAMAPWTGGSEQNGSTRDEVEFEIWKSGLSSKLTG